MYATVVDVYVEVWEILCCFLVATKVGDYIQCVPYSL